jgi:hypothetical protein
VLSHVTVSHSHSFRSVDCTLKLPQITLEPIFSCAYTKVEAIILNVYELHALNVLHCDLEKATFNSLLTDPPNHKEIKIFHVLVRYFDYKSGVKIY